ncbi:hypothetical protein Y032_0105g3697 [Ancylostoma ceylanicum]|uniref:Protein HIRA-like C-terminal domain-containing protein n=1 Tax=Ancylostoma ceylanicum TaxID=53326 RepID=A0A016TFH9_9BILA|nr:hypothetical protein Y032_0105g3697 [Ancylostoma ceylanicum]
MLSEEKVQSKDVDKIKAILSRQSIADCVVKDANLTSISMTSAGIPLLGFSTGNIFTFSLDMNCWQIVDSLTPLMKLCDSIDGDELPDGPVGRLLKRRKRLADCFIHEQDGMPGFARVSHFSRQFNADDGNC